MIWNNCSLIYENGSKTKNFKDFMDQSFSEFEKKVTNIENNVWYDLEQDICFGIDLHRLNSSKAESAFTMSGEKFVGSANKVFKDSPGRILQFYKNVMPIHKVGLNKEIVYKQLDSLSKFRNSKILIIGGGPSTNDVEWNAEDYDYVWSCNHFFMSDRLKEIDISFATISNEVDVSVNNSDLHGYLTKNKNTICCFEEVNTAKIPLPHLKKFVSLYEDRTMFSFTRYSGKIGSIPRLILMAMFFGVKEIHVIGMDGFKPESKRGDYAYHAFENKKLFDVEELNYRNYMRHYVMLWDYVLNTLNKQKNVKFQNLGQGHLYNMSTDISKQMFPLEEK